MNDKRGNGVPTLAEWAGGEIRFKALFDAFYAKVRQDALLAPVFGTMSPEHAAHVAAFVTEVLGGPKSYTGGGGSHAGMIRHHLGRHLTQAQRAHWVRLLLETADEAGLPDDPEFRAAFAGYLEWGSRLAVINSGDGVSAPEADVPMPAWDWGPPGGPWQG